MSYLLDRNVSPCLGDLNILEPDWLLLRSGLEKNKKSLCLYRERKSSEGQRGA